MRVIEQTGDMPTAIVVGAGIGGLSTAIGLRGIGWDVEVLERAERFAPVGAGITLWPNAVRGLEALGIQISAPTIEPGGIRTSRGRRLARWDPAALRERTGASIAPVTRAELHDTLLQALPDGTVRLGTEVTDVPAADLVVAADGVGSRLRNLLWPGLPQPADAGVTTWRGIAPAPSSGPVPLASSWGAGTEFGTAPLRDGRAYWFAAVRRARDETTDERAAALRRFGDFHDPVPELIRTTAEVIRLDIRHLATPPPSYVAGRVALLGDAAHAMPPNLGQGGGMAIEDAVVLTHALAGNPDVDSALARYDAERRRRATAVAREAALLARMMIIANPVVTILRTAAMRATPTSGLLRSVAKWADWAPPPLPETPRSR